MILSRSNDPIYKTCLVALTNNLFSFFFLFSLCRSDDQAAEGEGAPSRGISGADGPGKKNKNFFSVVVECPRPPSATNPFPGGRPCRSRRLVT